MEEKSVSRNGMEIKKLKFDETNKCFVYDTTSHGSEEECVRNNEHIIVDDNQPETLHLLDDENDHSIPDHILIHDEMDQETTSTRFVPGISINSIGLSPREEQWGVQQPRRRRAVRRIHKRDRPAIHPTEEIPKLDRKTLYALGYAVAESAFPDELLWNDKSCDSEFVAQSEGAASYYSKKKPTWFEEYIIPYLGFSPSIMRGGFVGSISNKKYQKWNEWCKGPSVKSLVLNSILCVGLVIASVYYLHSYT